MSIYDPSDYKTGDAVPSNKAMDLNDNAKVFDVFQNAQVPSVKSRLGIQIKTVWQQGQDFIKASNARDKAFDAQFMFKRIKSFSDAHSAGEKITDATRLNSYSTGSGDSVEWWGLIQSTTIPPEGLPIPATPDDNWSLVSSLSVDYFYSNLFSISGLTFEGYWESGELIPAKADRSDGYAKYEPISGKIIIPVKSESFTTGATFEEDYNNGLFVKINLLSNKNYLSNYLSIEQAFSALNDGDTLIIDKDYTESVGHAESEKSINIETINGAKINYTGTSTCIKFEKSPSQTLSNSIALKAGNSAIDVPNVSCEYGDIIVFKSTDVRFANVDGNYLFGHAAKVVRVTGSKVEFQPAITESFTSTTQEINKPFNLDIDVNFESLTNTSNASLLAATWCADSKFKVRIDGKGEQNVGLGVSGVNVEINAVVCGIENGYSPLGYGVIVTGSNLHGHVSGSNCRHVFDGSGSREIVNQGVEFEFNVTKSENAPDFLYTVGCHANAYYPKLTGYVGGKGNLVCDRTGTAQIDMTLDCLDSGYTSGAILINEMTPNGADYKFRALGGTCSVVLCNPTNEGSTNLKISGYVEGDKIIYSPKVGKINKVRMVNISGECSRIVGNDWEGCEADVEIRGLSDLKTVEPYTNDYAIGFNNPKSLKLRMNHCEVDDSQTTGLVRILAHDGKTINSIDVLISDIENANEYRAVEVEVEGTGKITTVRKFDVMSSNCYGTVNFNPNTDATFIGIARILNNELFNQNNPFTSSKVPILFSGNSMTKSGQFNLFSKLEPPKTNTNLSGSIVWEHDSKDYNNAVV